MFKKLMCSTALCFLFSDGAFAQAFTGPATISQPTTANDCVKIAATNGSNLVDSGASCGSGGGGSPGGSSGQIQYNNAGAFGGLSNGTAAQIGLAGLVGQPPFYAANYGAVCNGQTLADVTTTASSAVISSASHSFTNADVGKWVTIFAGTSTAHTGTLISGANTITGLGSQTGMAVNYHITAASGIPANTALLDVVPSTTATMTNTATASGSISLNFIQRINTTIISVSGGAATLNTNMTTNLTGSAIMTFGTDDTVAIQAADTAASAAGGGTVQLPLGVCITTASVILDNAVSITGEGPGKSIVKWINSADQSTPVIESRTQANSVACSQLVALNQQHDNTITNFEIDDSAGLQATLAVSGKGLGFSCSARSIVDHMYIHDSPQTCLATDSGFPTFATNNTLTNCGRLGTSTSVGGNGIGEGLAGLSGEGYTFSNNVIINPRHYGIFVEAESAATACAPVAIAANVIWQGGQSTTASAASLGTAGIGNSGGCGVVATGNSIFGDSDVTAQNWAGISQDSGTTNLAAGIRGTYVGNYITKTIAGIQITYSGNVPTITPARTVIADNTVVSVVAGCIQLVSASTGSALGGVDISGNHCASSGSSGLLFAGAATISNVAVAGNQFCDNGNVAGTTDYRKAGIAFGAPVAHITITGNQLCDDGAATQKYGIGVNTSIAVTDALVTSNIFSGNTTNAMNLLGTIAGSFANNRGLTAPTVTGTGTPTLTAGSDDWHWEATAGATATSIIVTYAYPNAHVASPFCAIVPQTQLAAFAYTISTVAVSITQTLTSGDLIEGLCQ